MVGKVWRASDGTHKLIVKDPNRPASDTLVNVEGEMFREMLT